MNCKPIKIIIDTSELRKIIINILAKDYGLFNLIVSDFGSIFTANFWLLLCFYLKIKQKLSTVFYLQIDSQIKKQNSIIKTYFQAFVNYK